MNFDHNALQLLIIFSFVIIVVLMKSIARVRRARMWHETARIAIEKGQPLPPAVYQDCSSFGQPRRVLLGGLILIGIGAALYLAPNSPGGHWIGAVPGFIGLAMIIYCLITRGSDGSGTQGPPPGGALP